VSFCGSSSRIEGRKLGESMEARRWNTAVSDGSEWRAT
jgi:hypothetical protein